MCNLVVNNNKTKMLLAEYIGDNEKYIEEFNNILLDNYAVISSSFALRLLTDSWFDIHQPVLAGQSGCFAPAGHLRSSQSTIDLYCISDMDIYVGDENHFHSVIGHLETFGWSITAKNNSSYSMAQKYTMHIKTLVRNSHPKKFKCAL